MQVVSGALIAHLSLDIHCKQSSLRIKKNAMLVLKSHSAGISETEPGSSSTKLQVCERLKGR
jgi:hypothetical protein